MAADEEKTLSYASTRRHSYEKVAKAALVLGFIATPLDIVFFFGVIPALLAILLGTICYIRLKGAPEPAGRRDAILGIVFGCIALLVATVCGISLRGI